MTVMLATNAFSALLGVPLYCGATVLVVFLVLLGHYTIAIPSTSPGIEPLDLNSKSLKTLKKKP